MATLANIRTRYKYALQDQASLLEEIAESASDVRDKAIEEAIRWYSRRLPQVKTVALAQSTTGFYAVPTDWKVFSRIVSVEFPLDQTPPQYLDQGRHIRLQRQPTGIFYFLDPNPSGTFRLSYTTKHDETAPTTIPDEHDGILGRWAAHVAAVEFASRYANSVQNNVDSVNYRTKEQEWRAVAKELWEDLQRELRRDEWAQLYSADIDTQVRGWRL